MERLTKPGKPSIPVHPFLHVGYRHSLLCLKRPELGATPAQELPCPQAQANPRLLLLRSHHQAWVEVLAEETEPWGLSVPRSSLATSSGAVAGERCLGPDAGFSCSWNLGRVVGMLGRAAFRERLSNWGNLCTGSGHSSLQKCFSECWQSWSITASLYLQPRLQLGPLGITHREISGWDLPPFGCRKTGTSISGSS